MPISAPFGYPEPIVIAPSGITNVTIVDQRTIVLALTTLTANATLNLVITSDIRAGALILIKVKTATTEVFTFGTGFIAPAVTGVAGKTWSQALWYDGVNYLPMGTKTQID